MLSASLNQFGTSSLEWSKSEIFIPLFLLGTLFVIVGVFMERDGLPERVVSWGWTILIWGLTIELFASIGQLAIDGEIGNRQRSEIITLESVSNAQQSKIISLERQASARVLDRKQYEAILSVKGKVKAVNIMSEAALEPNGFAGWIAGALQKAGVNVHFISSGGAYMTGITILYPLSLEEEGNLNDDPLFKAFTDAGLTPGAGSLKNWFPFMNIPRDVPIVFVGEKSIPLMQAPYVGEVTPAK